MFTKKQALNSIITLIKIKLVWGGRQGWDMGHGHDRRYLEWEF